MCTLRLTGQASGAAIERSCTMQRCCTFDRNLEPYFHSSSNDHFQFFFYHIFFASRSLSFFALPLSPSRTIFLCCFSLPLTGRICSLANFITKLCTLESFCFIYLLFVCFTSGGVRQHRCFLFQSRTRDEQVSESDSDNFRKRSNFWYLRLFLTWFIV